MENRKFEARKKPRGPKFETNSKQEIQNKYNVPNRRDRIRRFGFSEFEIFGCVCFGPRGLFRYSDFGFSAAGV
jgi:hypothetical protein